VFRPAAITASTDVPAYSIVLAVLLVACLAAALSLPRGRHATAVLRWGLGGTLATGAGVPQYLAGLASYLLSDALGGAILGSMLIYSAVTIAATLLGAAAGQSGSGRISMSPQGHSAAHRPQPLQ
jgi:hypothetical protein